ncbi:MAG: Sapep family Mn(2+)-dependent dipeptidase [Fimbriimonadaceae bacterium]
MLHPLVEAAQNWLRAHETELLADYQAMLRIPSLESEALPKAPFGKANREALDLALALSVKYGFKTADIEGYCGYAEFGKGEKMIMSLGHLDVVPTGPGWKYPEFGAEIHDGYVYARGATDDKGPTMASFYAMRALMAVAPDLGVRFRQVFGCNEESGFKCVARYVETEELPTWGIAPDSGWPLCHAEKGITSLVVSAPLYRGDVELLDIGGGQRPNIVIDKVVARLKVGPAAIADVKEKVAGYWDANVTTKWEGEVLTIEARGKAAHGSTPFMGDSAATRAFRFFFSIAPTDAQEYFERLLMVTHPSGVGLGIHGRDDETGDLTSNVGILSTESGTIRLLANIRYPATWKGEHVEERSTAFFKKADSSWSVTQLGDSPSLYFPLSSPLIKTLVDAYRAETGDTAEPFTMGGGTYARAVPNMVSVGTCWPGDGRAHETDERLKVEHLFKASRIYAHMLFSLGELALA